MGRTCAAWGLLALALVVVAAPRVDAPGLYYDEAFLAQQARDFVETGRTSLHPPGTREVFVLGRPFPLRNASYLGSLKSQLLMPALAVFGSGVEVLRLATLATGLLALLFAMLWTRLLFGDAVAVLAGALVAVDPGFLFFGLYEWGPYTTLLLCRGLGAWLLTWGWQRERSGAVVAGGLVLGLGVYARADFALIVAAAGIALLAAGRGAILRQALERWKTASAAAIAFVLGALPMLLAVAEVLQTSGDIASRGGPGYRAAVLWSVLDGSHFYRVVATGGLFEQLFEIGAPATGFGVVAIAAVVYAVVLLVRSDRRDPGASPLAFALVAVLLLALAMWALPGAVRAHHMLNLLPLPQLVVAAVAIRMWRSGGLVRGIAVAALVAVITSSGVATARTFELIEATGGRGRFSDAIFSLASEVDTPGGTVVSLDWGFHEPLLYLTREVALEEAIWTLPRALQRGRPWLHAGDEGHVYLVHEPRYDLFGFGPRLLELARDIGPERAEIRSYTDREGVVAFYAIRFRGPHRLAYTGRFEIAFPPGVHLDASEPAPLR